MADDVVVVADDAVASDGGEEDRDSDEDKDVPAAEDVCAGPTQARLIFTVKKERQR
jgi:hypothetical protein